MAYVNFYHYTSEAAADAIIQSGIINQSVDGGPDAKLGPGVYGTKLPPSAGKRAIARNNWLQGWKNRERRGRVEYFFRIRMSRHEVEEYSTGLRHIYLHKGFIYLNNYEWECMEV